MTDLTIDPVTFEVVWHRLLDTTEEMGIKYMRTSGSPVLVGAYDASTGICLPDGQLVAMGPYITTQAHVLRLIVQAVAKSRAKMPGIGAGDMFICNDPYLGATHQPDVATVAPFHHEGKIHAWVGSSGHWLDIGGSEPGGFNMTARSVFDEGLRLPPTRIVEGGVIREDLVELIMNHLREPLAELDLRGQIVSNQAGLQRLTAMYDEFGPAVVDAVMRDAISHVARRLRARLRQLPDGVWREVQFLDHDGHKLNMRRIVCTVTKQHDRLTVDFTGSDPEVDGFANCAVGGLRAAVMSGVCIMLGYDLPWNDGIAECVDIVAPARTIVTAEHPTPVSMSTISAIIVTLNATFGALSKMLLSSPSHHQEVMANWCGTSLGVSVIGMNDDGIMTVCAEASHFAAGCGARIDEDGVDTGGIIINTTANIPSIEATEAEYPVLYLFRRQMRDSGGAGTQRGGVAGEVAMIPYGTADGLETSFAGVGVESPNGFGLAGGLPGATVRYVQFRETGLPDVVSDGTPLPASFDELGALPGQSGYDINVSHAPFPRDGVDYHNWQGGGGYGDPLDRVAGKVADDVRAHLVSPEVASEIYGVVLASDGEPAVGATRLRREEQRRRRLERALPARGILERLEDVPTPAALAEAPASGSLRYGDMVEWDLARDVTRCVRCSHELASAGEDFRLGCLVEESDTSMAGPVRGQDYGTRRLVLRRFYCPGCGRQLETEVAMPSGPRSGFRLAVRP